MSCNLHNDDINLDDQSLFEYVSQLDAITDSIKYTPSNPKYANYDGMTVEQFKNKQTDDEDDDNEKKSSNGFLVACAIVIILLLVVCAVVYTGSCENIAPNYDNMVNFNSLSPEIGPDVRAIFVRN